MLITGATDGIGLAAAIAFARDGWRVTVMGRAKDRCEVACERIVANTANGNADYLVADLAEPDAVLAAARAYKKRYQRLNLLINNAGAAFKSRRQNNRGLEMGIATNHLGHFVLTRELQDLLMETAKTAPKHTVRVVNVSSELHRVGVNRDDINFEKGYSMRKSYGQSKAFNIMFSLELAERLRSYGVQVHAVTPGLVKTDIYKKTGSLPLRLAVWGLRSIGLRRFKTPAAGAKALMLAATSPALNGTTGNYLELNGQGDNLSTLTPDGSVADGANRAKLWRLSERWAEL